MSEPWKCPHCERVWNNSWDGKCRKCGAKKPQATGNLLLVLGDLDITNALLYQLSYPGFVL